MSFDPLTLIGAAISGIGSIMSGMAEAASQQAQARIADMNKEVSLENAARAIDRSQQEAYNQDMQTIAMLGQQEAVQAASGLTGRSQILARKTARELGRKDALNVRQAGEIDSYNYKVEAENQRANAELLRQQAGFSMLSGFFGAAKSLIGGASSIKSPTRFTSRFSTMQPINLLT